MLRARLATPLGTALSKYHNPSREIPHGGVLSPLLWLLHVNRVAANPKELMAKEINMEQEGKNLLVQIFANDISSAAGHTDRETAIKLAWLLEEILLGELRATGS